jgi:hypothetical protein
MNDVSGDFIKFWSAYPKKVGKDAALKAWNKKKPNIEEVLNALLWQVTSKQWQKEGGQFIPNPSTYINQGRWQDEPPVIQQTIEIRNKGHFMTDEQFTNWLMGGANGRLI